MYNSWDPYWNSDLLGMGQANPNLLSQHMRTGSVGSSQSSMDPNDPAAWSSTANQPTQSQMQPTACPMSSGNMRSSQPNAYSPQSAMATSTTPSTPSQNQLYSEEQHRQKQRIQMKQKYHRMTETERQEFNRKHRLSSYGINPKTTQLSFADELQIVEAKARQAAAAKQKYHGMTPEERKAFNEKRKQQRIHRKLEEDSIFSVPLEEATPEQQEKAQEIIEKKARIAENLHARYEAKTKPGRELKSWHNLLKNVIANPEKLEKLTEEEKRSRKRARDSKRYYQKKEKERKEKERDSPDSDSSLEILDDGPLAGNSDPSSGTQGTQDAIQNYKDFLENLNKKEADAARKAKRNEAAKLRYHRRMAKKKEELDRQQKEQEASNQEATSPEPVEVAEDVEMNQDSPSSTNSAFDELFDAFDRDERQKQRNAAAARERYHKLPEPVRKELKVKIYESQKERHRNMNSEDKKVFNQKRSEAEKRRRLQETELLRSEFAEITPGEIAKAQGIVNKMDERNEKERLRYSQMTYDQKLKRTERRKELRKIQREKEKQKKEEEEFDASILDLGLEPDDSNDTEPSYEDRFLNSILNNS